MNRCHTGTTLDETRMLNQDAIVDCRLRPLPHRPRHSARYVHPLLPRFPAGWLATFPSPPLPHLAPRPPPFAQDADPAQPLLQAPSPPPSPPSPATKAPAPSSPSARPSPASAPATLSSSRSARARRAPTAPRATPPPAPPGPSTTLAGSGTRTSGRSRLPRRWTGGASRRPFSGRARSRGMRW